jgi:hypothetical protein
MMTNKVVDDLVNIQGTLQPILTFGISVCTPPEGTISSSQCRILCFEMIGMYVCIFNILIRIRIFTPGSFILGAFVFGGGIL